MSDPIHNIKQEFHNQETSESFNDNNPNWKSTGKAEKLKKYYAVDNGGRPIKRFHLMKTNGQSLSIPYAMLPIISLNVEAHLLIMAHDIKIIIKGRNMQKLYEVFCGEIVMWVKESETTLDDESEDIYVDSIEIKSDLIE
jgi:hypothetical protein